MAEFFAKVVEIAQRYWPLFWAGTKVTLLISLTGTVTTMEGKFYPHLHMSAGDREGKVFGGHLNSATVSATCEMVVRALDGEVERQFDEKVGLNLFRFL